MDLQITVEESKAKLFVLFLKQLDFVDVKKTTRKTEKEAKKGKQKTPSFAYFGACPDWEMDAKELRATSNRKKAQW